MAVFTDATGKRGFKSKVRNSGFSILPSNREVRNAKANAESKSNSNKMKRVFGAK